MDRRTRIAALVTMIVVVGGVLAFVALSGTDDDTRVLAPATSTTVVPPTDAHSVPTTTTTTRPAEHLSASSALGFEGLGPVELGMTLDEAARAAGTTVAPSADCEGLVVFEGAPAGVSFVEAGGRIRRILVNEPPITTASGIGVGSTEADVLDAYSGVQRAQGLYSPLDIVTDPQGREIVLAVDNGMVIAMSVAASADRDLTSACD